MRQVGSVEGGQCRPVDLYRAFAGGLVLCMVVGVPGASLLRLLVELLSWCVRSRSSNLSSLPNTSNRCAALDAADSGRHKLCKALESDVLDSTDKVEPL